MTALDEGALVVAMAVVPELYSRNKMFALFTDSRLRRARKRAIALRTAVRQLTGGGARNVELVAVAGGRHRLTYELPSLAYVRRLDLSDAERACIVYLVERAESHVVPCRDEDRAIVEATLKRLVPVDAPDEPRAASDR